MVWARILLPLRWCAPGDAVDANNSATLSVKAVEPVVPAPTALTATAGDGGAVLSWLAPAERGAITDDVESYAPWIIDGVGEWTMHDGDYDVTAYINYDAGQYEKMRLPARHFRFLMCSASALISGTRQGPFRQTAAGGAFIAQLRERRLAYFASSQRSRPVDFVLCPFVYDR